MNIVVIIVAGVITSVSLIGNLYLIGYVLKETYSIRRADRKKSKKKRTKVPRAFSTKVSNDPTQPKTILEEEQWCEYSNMPSPSAYMND